MMANNSSSKWLLLKHDCLEVRHSFCRDALVYVSNHWSPENDTAPFLDNVPTFPRMEFQHYEDMRTTSWFRGFVDWV